jgi:hypothetical protein
VGENRILEPKRGAYSNIAKGKKCIKRLKVKLKKRDSFGDLGVGWRIILRWI